MFFEILDKANHSQMSIGRGQKGKGSQGNASLSLKTLHGEAQQMDAWLMLIRLLIVSLASL